MESACAFCFCFSFAMRLAKEELILLLHASRSIFNLFFISFSFSFLVGIIPLYFVKEGVVGGGVSCRKED